MPRSAPILLIFHPGALGDGLLALSALRVLRVIFPEYHVIWFGHKELGEVFVETNEVHQSYSFNSLNFFTYGGPKVFHQELFPSLFGRCERAVGWMDDSNGTWGNWFKTLGIKNFILRSPHDPSLSRCHMAERYIETLQPWFPTQQMVNQLEKFFNDEGILIFRQPKTMGQSFSLKERLIVLHPGSGSPHKCAPPALLASIVNGLMARPHRSISLVGGPADTDSLQKIQGLLPHLEPAILMGLDLLSVGCYLTQAQLFIGHDSGLSHLATRLGVPSVLLFGPTDPTRWAPRGKRIAVRRNPCHCLGWESVEQCTDKLCFSIPTNEVIAKGEELLCGMQASASRDPLKVIDECPSVSCLG